MNDNVKPLTIGLTGMSIKSPRKSALTRAGTTMNTLILSGSSPSVTLNAAERLGSK